MESLALSQLKQRIAGDFRLAILLSTDCLSVWNTSLVEGLNLCFGDFLRYGYDLRSLADGRLNDPQSLAMALLVLAQLPVEFHGFSGVISIKSDDFSQALLVTVRSSDIFELCQFTCCPVILEGFAGNLS